MARAGIGGSPKNQQRQICELMKPRLFFSWPPSPNTKFKFKLPCTDNSKEREFVLLRLVSDGCCFPLSAVPAPDVPGQPDQQHAKCGCSQHQYSPHALSKQPLRHYQPHYRISARGPGHYKRTDWWHYLGYYFFRLSRSPLGPTLSSAVIQLPNDDRPLKTMLFCGYSTSGFGNN